MRRPYLHFYPGDWQSSANLRRCSHTEKGIWIDLLCLLHDQESYGVLRWSLVDIARVIGTSKKRILALVENGVLKGADVGERFDGFNFTPTSGRRHGPTVCLIDQCDGPLWFSSRMVIDEYKRKARAGEFGAGFNAELESPKPPFSDSLKPPFDEAETDHQTPPLVRTLSCARAGAHPSSSSSLSLSEEIDTSLSSSISLEEERKKSTTTTGAVFESHGQMAKTLRDLGVLVTPDNPHLVHWCASGVTTEMATQAVKRARIYKPEPEPIPAGYIDRIIHEEQVRHETNGRARHSTSDEIFATGCAGAFRNERAP